MEAAFRRAGKVKSGIVAIAYASSVALADRARREWSAEQALFLDGTDWTISAAGAWERVWIQRPWRVVIVHAETVPGRLWKEISQCLRGRPVLLLASPKAWRAPACVRAVHRVDTARAMSAAGVMTAKTVAPVMRALAAAPDMRTRVNIVSLAPPPVMRSAMWSEWCRFAAESTFRAVDRLATADRFSRTAAAEAGLLLEAATVKRPPRPPPFPKSSSRREPAEKRKRWRSLQMKVSVPTPRRGSSATLLSD